MSFFNNPVMQRKLYFIVFVFYAALVLLGTFHHESWADEAQAWLLVRDNSFLQLLKILPSEGHPPLWYLLILPFVKSGVPYESVKFLSAVISIAATGILLFRTNLHIIIKVLLPFSYYFIYGYAVFARSYCLILFFTAVIIWLYPLRFKKPLLYALCIIGLFNTHVLAFSFCFGLTLLFLADAIQQKLADKQIILCTIAMLAGGLYLLPYLGTHEMVSFFGTETANHYQRLLAAIDSALFPGHPLISLIIFSVLVFTMVQKPKAFILLLTGIAGILYILAFRYTGNEKHAGVLLLVFLCVCCIAEVYNTGPVFPKLNLGKYNFIVLAIVLALQIPKGYSHYIADIHKPYSSSGAAAAYIKKHSLYDNIIVAYWAGSASALLPYMPGNIKFYNAECERYGTYQVYDSCYMKGIWRYPVDYAVKVAYNKFGDSLNKVVLLLHEPVMPQAEKYVDLIYTNPEPAIIWQENFYIYKFKSHVK